MFNALPPMTLHDWLRWAIKSNIHPHIIGFICVNQDRVSRLSTKTLSVLDENLKRSANDEKLKREISYCVFGRELGQEFYEFHKWAR